MYQEYVKELLERYDELRMNSNQGSWDNWFMTKFRITRIMNWKPYERLYQRTYTHPFAIYRFHKEIKLDLSEFRYLFQKLNVQKGTNDFDTSQSLKMINNYLEKISQTKKKNKLMDILWKIIGSSIFASIITPIVISAEQYYPIILMLGVMMLLPFSTWYMADRIFLYVTEKLWYRTSEKKLGISKLRSKLTTKLIAEINTPI
ncbi:MAG: hypothetical protein ACREAK_04020 [Nitrosarchaeum sp.]